MTTMEMMKYQDLIKRINDDGNLQVRSVYVVYKAIKMGYLPRSKWFDDNELMLDEFCAYYDTQGFDKTCKNYDFFNIKKFWNELVQINDHTKYLYELYISKFWASTYNNKMNNSKEKN